MNQVGIDAKTKKRTLQLASVIQKFNDTLQKKTDPKVTREQIKEFFEHRHTYQMMQKAVEAECLRNISDTCVGLPPLCDMALSWFPTQILFDSLVAYPEAR